MHGNIAWPIPIQILKCMCCFPFLCCRLWGIDHYKLSVRPCAVRTAVKQRAVREDVHERYPKSYPQLPRFYNKYPHIQSTQLLQQCGEECTKTEDGRRGDLQGISGAGRRRAGGSRSCRCGARVGAGRRACARMVSYVNSRSQVSLPMLRMPEMLLCGMRYIPDDPEEELSESLSLSEDPV